MRLDVDDGGAVVDGVVDRLRDVDVQRDAARPDHLEREDAAAEARTDAADAVLCASAAAVPATPVPCAVDGRRAVGVVVDEVVAR